jgi:hypothetical protein
MSIDSPDNMPRLLREAYLAESARHLSAVADLIAKWPNFRNHISCGELGAAVAVADSFGVDAEAFIASLRDNCEKPDVLVPPEAS